MLRMDDGAKIFFERVILTYFREVEYFRYLWQKKLSTILKVTLRSEDFLDYHRKCLKKGALVLTLPVCSHY